MRSLILTLSTSCLLFVLSGEALAGPNDNLAVYASEDAFEACLDAWVAQVSYFSYQAKDHAHTGYVTALQARENNSRPSWSTAGYEFELAAGYAAIAFLVEGNSAALPAMEAALKARDSCDLAYDTWQPIINTSPILGNWIRR